jgi:hypothetical protein
MFLQGLRGLTNQLEIPLKEEFRKHTRDAPSLVDTY